MKTRNFIYVALAFMALSCAKEIAPETSAHEQDYNYIPKTFTAGIDIVKDANDVQSKVALVNGYQVEWRSGDQVAVFDNISKARNPYTASEAGAVTTLSGEVPSGSTEFLAIYPDRGLDNNGNPRLTMNGDRIDGCYLSQMFLPKTATFSNTGFLL